MMNPPKVAELQRKELERRSAFAGNKEEKEKENRR